MRVSALDRLQGRIDAREARVGVVGLGYVGLPVAVSFAEAGFQVLGVDRDLARVRAVQDRRSFLKDVSEERIRAVRHAGLLSASTSYAGLRDADAMLVCVSTPISEGSPDLCGVVTAGESLAKVLKPGSLVVLESTSYPGTTEEVLRPLLEAAGLAAGSDFFLAFSPERIDPGNAAYGFADIPKVVGGIDQDSTSAAASLYRHVVPKVVTVSGTREAEFAKLIENTFRHVNIGLINELAMCAHDLRVNIWEAIDAAATKPFGFTPFWPGPGWGGHCIPLDPTYLSWAARRNGSRELRFVGLANDVNAEMPEYVVQRAASLLAQEGKELRGAKVLGIGVAYKAGTEDTRESAGLRVLSLLSAHGARVSYHDPLVPEATVAGRPRRSAELTEAILRDSDLVLALVPQMGVEWGRVSDHAQLVLDCCNALNGWTGRVVTL